MARAFPALRRTPRCVLAGAGALLALGTLCGCVSRTVVLRPQLEVQVVDEGGAGVAAALTLYRWSYPQRTLGEELALRSDPQGVVFVPQQIASETVFPFMMHGVPEHRWTFCVARPGSRTLIGSAGGLAPGMPVRLTLPLTTGTSVPVCDDFERLPFHPGRPRPDIEAQDARLGGVYEVVGE